MQAAARLVQHDAGDLIASAAAGDEDAFRRIIAAHHDDMRRVCVYVAGDRVIADEATQTAWVIAWNKTGNVREHARLRPWLMAVAVNEAKQLLRKRRRRAEMEVPTDGSLKPGGMDPSADVGSLDLRRAMARLDLMTGRYWPCVMGPASTPTNLLSRLVSVRRAPAVVSSDCSSDSERT